MTREELEDALDRIGEAAVRAGAVLDIVVYGGSALVLASNFRYASEDVDVSPLPEPTPEWLREAVAKVAREKGWEADWFNDAVSVHLSQAADDKDFVSFGSYPRGDIDGSKGLRVFVPSTEYMLALKLKAFRLGSAGEKSDLRDILNLISILRLSTPEEAIEILGRYFPRTAEDPVKQRFLLRHLWNDERDDAPFYPFRGG